MSTNHYLPRRDQEKVLWLNNFSSKLPTQAASVGVSGAEVTSVQDDAAAFSYWTGQVETFTTEKEERVEFKNILRDGPLGSPAPSYPILPTIPVPPTAVLPGIFGRIRLLVQRIKNSPNYTTSIGTDLGIIGSEDSTDHSTLKPELKLILHGGAVEVQWKKSAADAIRIECDRGIAVAGQSGWALAGIDTMPHFTDTTPITVPAVWKYRAIYLIGHEPVGQWRNVPSISVGA
jgi:hypothetical protein